jgi:uncharacterized protein
MRRAKHEITDPAELDRVLGEAQVLFLGLHDAPAPYVLPVCYGHDRGVLYVHSAAIGTKVDLLRACPDVGFSASTDMTVIPGAAACAFTCTAESVVGVGRARIVEDAGERTRGLEAIMRHYDASRDQHVFSPDSLSRTLVIAIDIGSLRGKRVG